MPRERAPRGMSSISLFSFLSFFCTAIKVTDSTLREQRSCDECLTRASPSFLNSSSHRCLPSLHQYQGSKKRKGNRGAALKPCTHSMSASTPPLLPRFTSTFVFVLLSVFYFFFLSIFIPLSHRHRYSFTVRYSFLFLFMLMLDSFPSDPDLYYVHIYANVKEEVASHAVFPLPQGGALCSASSSLLAFTVFLLCISVGFTSFLPFLSSLENRAFSLFFSVSQNTFLACIYTSENTDTFPPFLPRTL